MICRAQYVVVEEKKREERKGKEKKRREDEKRKGERWIRIKIKNKNKIWS
jgi:hypothetical protein